MTIEVSSGVRQSDEPIAAEVDGEVVMVRVEQGNDCGLDEVGGRVWELTDEPAAVDAVRDRLMVAFGVGRATCEADTIRLFEGMTEQGLVRVDGTAG